MSTDAETARYEQWINNPFRPANAGGISVPVELRVAHSLDYIAAQLGQINAKLSMLLPDQKTPGKT